MGRYRKQGLGLKIITHNKFALVSRAARRNVYPRKSSSARLSLGSRKSHCRNPSGLQSNTEAGGVGSWRLSPAPEGCFLEGLHAPDTEEDTRKAELGKAVSLKSWMAGD